MNWSRAGWGAALVYIHWLALTAAFFFAKFSVTCSRRNKESSAGLGEKLLAYLLASVVVASFALYSGDRLGTHTEGGDYDEPGEVVQDWEPTDAQVHEHELKLLLIYLPAAFIGLATSYRKDRALTPEERLRICAEMNRAPSSDY